MSYPISDCMISKAALGDSTVFNQLVDAVYHNRGCNFGIYTQFGCRCDPPCPIPSDAQMDDLNRRINEAVKARVVAHPPRPVGNFSKWIFPVIKRPPFWRRVYNKMTGKKTWNDLDLHECLSECVIGSTTEEKFYTDKPKTPKL